MEPTAEGRAAGSGAALGERRHMQNRAIRLDIITTTA